MNMTQQVYSITEEQLKEYCEKYASIAQIIQKEIGLKQAEKHHTASIKEKMDKWNIKFTKDYPNKKGNGRIQKIVNNITKEQMKDFIDKYNSIKECIEKELKLPIGGDIFKYMSNKLDEYSLQFTCKTSVNTEINKSNRQILNEITEDDLLELADKYNSISDILRNKFNMSITGKNTKIISNKMYDWQIDFLNPWKPNQKYNRIIKECPVCSKEFTTVDGGTEERFTCSRACSNTHFRSGKNNGNYEGKNYRTVCFAHNKKECIICGEDKIVAVHHYDENHSNNEPSNLIPLCPTHHQYLHSRYKDLIQDKVDNYQKELSERIKQV